MNKLKFGTEVFVAVFIAMICSILILCGIYQEECIDAACVAIENYDQVEAKSNIDKVWFLDAAGSKKETMLMVACKSGNGEIIEYLVTLGANVNYSPNGHLTPLELFCRDGYKSGVSALYPMIQAGLRQSVYSEKPAIFHLAENYYWMSDEQKEIATDITITLLRYGAPFTYGNTSLLHMAAKGDMDDLFYTIIHSTNGLRLINSKDQDGNTPWDVAIKNGSVNVQKVIRNLEAEYTQDQQIEPEYTEGTIYQEEDISSDDNNLDETEWTEPDN